MQKLEWNTHSFISFPANKCIPPSTKYNASFQHFIFITYVFACRHGLSRSGSEYGPLTDLPDWSFAGIVSSESFSEP